MDNDGSTNEMKNFIYTMDELTAIRSLFYAASSIVNSLKTNGQLEIAEILNLREAVSNFPRSLLSSVVERFQEESVKPIDFKLNKIDLIYGFLWRIIFKIKMLPKEIKWFFQRGKRGYADCDIWSLDDYLADVISNAVSDLRENSSGHPSELTENEWSDILFKISKGFRTIRNLDDGIFSPLIDKMPIGEVYKIREERRAEAKEGLNLFVEWFDCLWD